MGNQNADTSAAAFEAESGVATQLVDVSSETVIATPLTNDAPTPSQKFFTEEDLAKVREQEKNKLYSQINSLKSENDELKKTRDAEATAERAKREAEEASRLEKERAAAEAEMDVRELLKKREEEFNQRLKQESDAREALVATLEREKQFSEFSDYRRNRLDAERENIAPELLGFLQGDTPEELDKSLEALKTASAQILESAQSAMQNARREMTGTKTTLPPAGPMDINSEQRNYSAAEIAAMPMNEYAKYRQRILSNQAQGRGQGLFPN